MATEDKRGERSHHLIDVEFGARELRQLGARELEYLAEVMRGTTLSNYTSEHSMTRRFEEAFARRIGAKKRWRRAVP